MSGRWGVGWITDKRAFENLRQHILEVLAESKKRKGKGKKKDE